VPPPASAAAAPAALGAEARRDVVAKLGEALRDRYVFPQVGQRAAETIERALAAGTYDSLADPQAFASRLSSDVAAVAHDKHLNVWSTAAPPPPPPAGAARPATEAGIVRADRLDGGIGYIEVVGFPPQRAFKPALDKAMAGLAGSRALILDIRRNGGGSPDGVAYLVSFLLTPGRPINDIVSRVAKTNDFIRESFRSVETPVSFAKVPVYVLTGKDTFSGGEEFAYDIQALKRGTLIGEATGGGANPTGVVNLGHDVAAMIPFGRAENPVTHSNWEGRGVQPDLRVPAGEALAAALKRAGGKPARDIAAASRRQVFAPRSTPRPGSEAALRRLLAGYAGGQPDYAAMAPDLADRIRAQLPRLQAQFSALGELRSMRFHGPDMMGGDEYELHFVNGNRLMALVVGPDGKIVAASNAIPLP
jgi:Peptidase family S41/N-terminal domain of Peptidase_S41 in eukaryotic IRBP